MDVTQVGWGIDHLTVLIIALEKINSCKRKSSALSALLPWTTFWSCVLEKLQLQLLFDTGAGIYNIFLTDGVKSLALSTSIWNDIHHPLNVARALRAFSFCFFAQSSSKHFPLHHNSCKTCNLQTKTNLPWNERCLRRKRRLPLFKFWFLRIAFIALSNFSSHVSALFCKWLISGFWNFEICILASLLSWIYYQPLGIMKPSLIVDRSIFNTWMTWQWLIITSINYSSSKKIKDFDASFSLVDRYISTVLGWQPLMMLSSVL